MAFDIDYLLSPIYNLLIPRPQNFVEPGKTMLE